MLNLCCRTCDEVWDGPSEDTACPFCGSRDVWGETRDAREPIDPEEER
jgi:RNA polymerase subunit RPABC4/transcription elongation factor Spt4